MGIQSFASVVASHKSLTKRRLLSLLSLSVPPWPRDRWLPTLATAMLVPSPTPLAMLVLDRPLAIVDTAMVLLWVPPPLMLLAQLPLMLLPLLLMLLPLPPMPPAMPDTDM